MGIECCYCIDHSFPTESCFRCCAHPADVTDWSVIGEIHKGITMEGNELVTRCDCGDPAHMMAFHYWRENDPLMDELYVSVQLNQLLPWWKRIWAAIKYIFGKRSRYSFGHWDEGNISRESAKELKVLLEKFIQRGEVFEPSN